MKLRARARCQSEEGFGCPHLRYLSGTRVTVVWPRRLPHRTGVSTNYAGDA